ncbi:RDD family protein [Bacillus solitudinis]|uniref:RDD family protein n=1 Tax=Bacillus solitudinis TaxID=2014074 RepID=UPI000C23A8A5|nr:RDD family protein [Bacillus solitudinis]
MERVGFWIRAVAMIIDGIFLGILQMIISFIFGGGFNLEGANTGLPLILSIIVSILYYVWFQTIYNGQTIGKKILGIRVATLHGERVKMGRMFVREVLGKLLSYLILFVGFLMAAGKSKRALHDYVAKTIVIRAE